MRTKTSKRMRKATKTGTNHARRAFLSLLLVPVCVAAAEKRKKEQEKKLAAVIAGTVFRDPGFTLPGAAVELTEIRLDKKRPKSWKAATDARGEYAFPVPPLEQKYKIRAAFRGFQSEEKETASIPGARVDVFFTLKPALP